MYAGKGMGMSDGDSLTGGPGATGPDSREKLAADLRKLRLQAGNPTLAKLQRETGVSRMVLSEALSGRQLPSARTVDAIARACGASPSAWVDRRDELAGHGAAGAAPVTTAEEGNQDAAATTAARPSRWRRRTAIWLAVGAFVVGAIVSGTVAALVVSQTYAAELASVEQALAEATAPVEEGPQIAVTNGMDPAMTPCVDDAKIATGDTRTDNSLIEIIWSNKCYAGWARVTRYDGLNDGNTVTIAIYPEPAPDGPDRQEATEHDVQGAYTTLVVRPTPDTLLCADGSFTVDGKRIDLGDPICI